MAEKKIGGREFRCDKMLATEALKLQVKLVKFIGPALDKLPALIGQKSSSVALSALSEIVAKSDPDQTLALIQEILSTAKVRQPSGYQDINIDLDFTDHLDQLYEVVLWVLKEQFGSFFSGILAGGGRKKAGTG